MQCYYATLYLVDRAYGGAEEGGWWFDCGVPQLHPINRCFDNEEEAYEYLNSKDVRCAVMDLNEGRADLNSVNSDGVYKVLVDDSFPAPFPDVRPHYE